MWHRPGSAASGRRFLKKVGVRNEPTAVSIMPRRLPINRRRERELSNSTTGEFRIATIPELGYQKKAIDNSSFGGREQNCRVRCRSVPFQILEKGSKKRGERNPSEKKVGEK